MKGFIRHIGVLVLAPQLFLVGALAAASLLLPSPSHAQTSCFTTETCRAPKIGPWRYWVGNGINKWFHSAGDAEATIYAAILAGNNQICTLTVTSHESDVYIGLGSYPGYYLGIDVTHSTLVHYDIVAPISESCQWTNQTSWGYQHNRDVTCDAGFALKGGTAQVPAYCGKPIDDEDSEKMQGSPPSQCKVGNPCDLGSGNKIEIELDYRGSGAFPISFSRTYNGLEAYRYGNAYPPLWQPFGDGWSATYFQRVLFSEWGGRSTARAYRPDGRVLSFSLSGSQYVGEADVAERLTRLVDCAANHLMRVGMMA